MDRGRIAFAVATLVALGACTAEEPVGPRFDLSPPRKDVYLLPDQSESCPSVPTLPAPKLDAYPNPTAYALQPFRGQCPGASLVTATGGSGTAAPANVGSSGKFCIEVKLLPDAQNTVRFQCVDAKGCVSNPTTATILHKTQKQADAGVSAPVNLAKGQPISVRSNATIKQGQASYINDNNKNTSAEINFNAWTSGYTWVRIDLGKSYTVSTVKLAWGPYAAKKYATSFNVLLSAKTAPTEPTDGYNADWTVAYQEQSGIATPKDMVINPTQARYAALVLVEDAQTTLWDQQFDLAELEVWGQDPNATPPPPADRCK